MRIQSTIRYAYLCLVLNNRFVTKIKNGEYPDVPKSLKKQMVGFSANYPKLALLYLVATKAKTQAILRSNYPLSDPDHQMVAKWMSNINFSAALEPVSTDTLFQNNKRISSKLLSLYQSTFDKYQKLSHDLMVARWNLLESSEISPDSDDIDRFELAFLEQQSESHE